MIKNMVIMEKKEVGGFIIFKNDQNGIKILSLFKHNGQIDLPKGRKDITDQTILYTAIRETFEETNILLDKNEILLSTGKQFHHMTFFIAKTNKKPEIKKNPVTNLYEHDSFAWLTPEEFIANAPKYLIKPVIWAIRKIYKK